VKLFAIEAAVANQFAVQEQNRDLVAITRPNERILIHIGNVQRHIPYRWQRRQILDHFLAQPAAGPRVQRKARRLRQLVLRRRCTGGIAVHPHRVCNEFHRLRRHLTHRGHLVALYDGREGKS
jgi:hypothetical protein